MSRDLTLARPGIVVLVALTASVVLAACGGSGPARTGAASTMSAEVSFAACVRIHGVPDFPDPNARGGAGHSEVKTLAEPTEVVQKAEEVCRDNPTEIAQESVVSTARLAKLQAGALAYAKCVRAHGAANFPDPTVSRGPGGRGTEMSLPFGSGALTPGTARARELRSPTLKAAIATCSSLVTDATPGPTGTKG